MRVRVEVEYEWNGHDSHWYRLTLPNGEVHHVRQHVAGWTRRDASRVLDYLERETALHRGQVRFVHR